FESNTPASTAPAIVVLNAFSSGGAQYQGTRAENQIEVSDVVTLPAGTKQVFRGGLLFWRGGYDSSISSNAGGTFTFSSLDAFIAGRPMTYTRRLGAPVCCYSVSQAGLWAQDDIALSKTAAISVGLRQEYESDMPRS